MSTVDSITNLYTSLTSKSTTSTGSANSASSASSTSSASNYSLDSVDFLNLFLTQLQNQDPLNPTDIKDMSSQLYDLSSLQETQKTNEYLVEQIQYLKSIGSSGAIQLIGKTVASEGNEIGKSGDQISGMTVDLDKAASSATITIYDADGNKVKTLTEKDLSAGRNSFTWDGTDDQGKTVADGTYSYKVSATDSSGSSVDLTQYTTNKVTASLVQDNENYLLASSGLEIPYSDVTMAMAA